MTPTCRTLLDVWHKTLDQDPNDFATRALMADWYADQGDTDAESCLRWQAREGKRPLRLSPGAGLYAWYDAAVFETGYDPESDLPRHLFHALPGVDMSTDYVSFPSRRVAEDALLAAWRALAARGQAPC